MHLESVIVRDWVVKASITYVQSFNSLGFFKMEYLFIGQLRSNFVKFIWHLIKNLY